MAVRHPLAPDHPSSSVRFALSVPNFGDYADVARTADLAAQADVSGWDGFFVWDHVNGAHEAGAPMADPWVLVTAIAVATERIRIGTMVTPLARRRPWKLARETVSIDHLSGGRLTLGVGLGYPPDVEFGAFGEDTGDRIRAEKLDEGLSVLAGLWSGEPFSFEGTHHGVRDVVFRPRPVQRPRIPVWVAQMWPHRRPLRRAARWDGVVPMDPTDFFPSPGQVETVVDSIRAMRGEELAFDVMVPTQLPEGLAAARDLVATYDRAGATWLQVGASSAAEVSALTRSGPPSR